MKMSQKRRQLRQENLTGQMHDLIIEIKNMVAIGNVGRATILKQRGIKKFGKEFKSLIKEVL